MVFLLHPWALKGQDRFCWPNESLEWVDLSLSQSIHINSWWNGSRIFHPKPLATWVWLGLFHQICWIPRENGHFELSPIQSESHMAHIAPGPTGSMGGLGTSREASYNSNLATLTDLFFGGKDWAKTTNQQNQIYAAKLSGGSRPLWQRN